MPYPLPPPLLGDDGYGAQAVQVVQAGYGPGGAGGTGPTLSRAAVIAQAQLRRRHNLARLPRHYFGGRR